MTPEALSTDCPFIRIFFLFSSLVHLMSKPNYAPLKNNFSLGVALFSIKFSGEICSLNLVIIRLYTRRASILSLCTGATTFFWLHIHVEETLSVIFSLFMRSLFHQVFILVSFSFIKVCQLITVLPPLSGYIFMLRILCL